MQSNSLMSGHTAREKTYRQWEGKFQRPSGMMRKERSVRRGVTDLSSLITSSSYAAARPACSSSSGSLRATVTAGQTLAIREIAITIAAPSQMIGQGMNIGGA